MDYPYTTATLLHLPNGLTLILDPDPAAPVISAQLWVESGSIHEDSCLGSGLSHFLEHMVFKGGGRFSADDLAIQVQAAGGHWNAYTTFERTVYFIDGPSSGARTFLEILAAMVFSPHLPESEFEKEKDVIRREIDMGLDDPGDVASRQLFATAFSHDPRRHPVIGHRELFDRLTYQDLVQYHQNRYSPERCALCLSGDFQPEELLPAIEEFFGQVTRRGGTEPLIPRDPPSISPREARSTFSVPTSRIAIAWKTPPLAHPDAPAYDLAAAILGRGRSARLYRKLREEKALALEISAWSWSQADADGLFAISAEADPEQRDHLILAILAEVQDLTHADLDDDVAKARRQLAASQFRTLTTASGRATDLASNWHEARDLDFTRRYLDRLAAVTVADVRRILSQLTESRSILSILDPLDTPPPPRRGHHNTSRPEPETFTLPNGLTVSLLPDPRVPLFTAQIAVRAGIISESPELAGINALLAATLPQATRRLDAASLASRLESLGASLSAASGNNALLVQLSGLSADLPTLLPLLGEVVGEPALSSDSIEREKASMIAAVREEREDPLSTAFRLARQALFGPSGYGIPPHGEENSLAGLDRLALSAHHSLHFRGPNLTLALAGAFEPADAREWIRNAFASIPSGQSWTPPATSLLEGSAHNAHLEKKQAVLALAYPGTPALSPDRFAARMIQEWCSDMAGPLFTRIREELGLAYQVGATQFHGHDCGFFGFYLATDPSQLALAESELLAEVRQIASEGIPADAFERVRATVLSSIALAQQSPSSIARAAAIDVLFGLPATHHRELSGIFSAITPDQVRDCAREILHKDPVIVRVHPPLPA